MKISDRALRILINHALGAIRNMPIECLPANRRVGENGEKTFYDHIGFQNSVSEEISKELEIPVRVMDTGGVLVFFFGKRQFSINKPRWFDELQNIAISQQNKK